MSFREMVFCHAATISQNRHEPVRARAAASSDAALDGGQRGRFRRRLKEPQLPCERPADKTPHPDRPCRPGPPQWSTSLSLVLTSPRYYPVRHRVPVGGPPLQEVLQTSGRMPWEPTQIFFLKRTKEANLSWHLAQVMKRTVCPRNIESAATGVPPRPLRPPNPPEVLALSKQIPPASSAPLMARLVAGSPSRGKNLYRTRPRCPTPSVSFTGCCRRTIPGTGR